MQHRHTYQSRPGATVEIYERTYRQHLERPLIETRLWESLDESRTLLFEETDPARRIVEPVETVLGRIPPEVVAALESMDYELQTESPSERSVNSG